MPKELFRTRAIRRVEAQTRPDERGCSRHHVFRDGPLCCECTLKTFSRLQLALEGKTLIDHATVRTQQVGKHRKQRKGRCEEFFTNLAR